MEIVHTRLLLTKYSNLFIIITQRNVRKIIIIHRKVKKRKVLQGIASTVRRASSIIVAIQRVSACLILHTIRVREVFCVLTHTNSSRHSAVILKIGKYVRED